MFDIKSLLEPNNLLYILIIYLGIVMAKRNKNTIISLIIAFLTVNLMNLDLIRDNYAMQFMFIVIYEIANVIISFIALNLVYNYAEMRPTGITTLVEILVSIWLVFIYAYTSAWMLTMF